MSLCVAHVWRTRNNPDGAGRLNGAKGISEGFIIIFFIYIYYIMDPVYVFFFCVFWTGRVGDRGVSSRPRPTFGLAYVTAPRSGRYHNNIAALYGGPEARPREGTRYKNTAFHSVRSQICSRVASRQDRGISVQRSSLLGVPYMAPSHRGYHESATSVPSMGRNDNYNIII